MKPKYSLDRDWSPYMKRALELATIAEQKGDIPVGALLVDIEGKIVTETHNQRELMIDPTAHAEILALQAAAKIEQAWRLRGYTMVVTLEPCVMCAGALSLSRLDRVVFGCFDTRAGAMGSRYNIHNDEFLNHKIITVSGVLEEECRAKIKDFFRASRAEGRSSKKNS